MNEPKRELFKIFAIVFPLAVVLTFLIQLKWNSSSVVDWPNLYGFFYPVTSDAIGSTFNFEYYIKGWIIHLLVFGIIAYLLVKVIDTKLKRKSLKKILIIIVWIGFIIIVLPKLIIIKDADFKWDYDKTFMPLTDSIAWLNLHPATTPTATADACLVSTPQKNTFLF